MMYLRSSLILVISIIFSLCLASVAMAARPKVVKSKSGTEMFCSLGI